MGYELQALMTDQGTEDLSSMTADFLRLNGINKELSERAAHGKLFVAERMWYLEGNC